MQQMIFLLQILLLAQHFSATIMPSSGAREYYTEGCCLWYLVLPANRTHNPQLNTIPTTWKPKHQIPQVATFCIILKLLMIGIMVLQKC
jgi:hypothetical protein